MRGPGPLRASRFIGDAAQGRVVGANQAGPPDWPEATQPSQSGQLNGVVRTGGSHPAFGGRPRAASWYQAYPLALTGPATTKPSCPALIVPSWVPAVPAVARTVRPSTVDLARPSTLIVGAAGEGLGVSSGGEAVAEAVRDGCGVSVGLGDARVVPCRTPLSHGARPRAQLDLSRFAGRTPVELIGRVHFPRIGELPYLLTLGPHDFLWFELT